MEKTMKRATRSKWMHVLVTPKIHKQLKQLANDPGNPRSVNELINRCIALILKAHGKVRKAA
jgi:hypothetical protein